MNGQILYDILVAIAIFALIPIFIKMSKFAKRINNIEGYYNSLTGTILILYIGIHYLIMSFIGNPIIIYPFNVLILIWIAIILGVQGFYYFMMKKSEASDQPNFIKNEDFTFSHELRRKSTHLLGLLLVACYFWISIPVFDMVQQFIIIAETANANIWGMVFININPSYIPQMISIFAIICTCYLILIPDIIRVFNYKYSMFKKFSIVMRNKEKNAIGPHICLVIGSLVPMIIIPEYLISMAGIIIAIFSDAAASLVGRKFGKHKLPFNKRTGKTFEGLLGGIIIAILVPLPILLFGYDIFTTITLAITGAVIVSIIDIITPIVTDNYLNPICASIGMYLVYLLI